MQLSIRHSAFALLLLSFIFIGCEDDFQTIPEPTFDNVPETMDISGAQEEEVTEGVIKYVVEEGNGPDNVTKRDAVSLYITLRTEEGEIIYSSFQNDQTEPVDFQVASIQIVNNPQLDSYSQPRAYTDGLRDGLIGMQRGERMVLIVEPEQGFGNIFDGLLNTQYREATLRYDITLETIY
ncbi:MAG: FKBP-type peptidyl-prolyl cis-trans isomerase [Balneolaceae bacterium]